MAKLVYAGVHLSPNVCDSLVELHVKLVCYLGNYLFPFAYLCLMLLHSFVDFTAELIKGFFVSFVRLLLSEEVKVFSACPSRDLIVDVLELVLKLELKRLQHLLHFYDLSLAVQYRFNLRAARLLVQCCQSMLFVHLGLEPLVKLLEIALPLNLALQLFKLLQDARRLLLRLLLHVFRSLMKGQRLVFTRLHLLEQVLGLLLEAFEH